MSTPTIEPREPRFAWGQAVRAAVDLYNDGSVPDVALDQLLIAAGGPGEIVQIGQLVETKQPLYLVDFGLVVLGCLEEELLGTDTLNPAPGVMA